MIIGTFGGLVQDATVDLGTFNGNAASCQVSYTGDSEANTTTGGNDVVLYNFIGTEQPPPLGTLITIM